jgi:hypothetical protein
MGRGKAVEDDELNEGRHGGSGSWEADLHVGHGGPRSGLQKVAAPASLSQEKGAG